MNTDTVGPHRKKFKMIRPSRSFVTSEVPTQDRTKSRNQHEKLRKEGRNGGKKRERWVGKEQKIVVVWRNKTYIRHKSDRGKLSKQKRIVQ